MMNLSKLTAGWWSITRTLPYMYANHISSHCPLPIGSEAEGCGSEWVWPACEGKVVMVVNASNVEMVVNLNRAYLMTGVIG